mmetsp:Transcript_9018/g.23669  ORF Transcript_9018/g.23669 Transcript_9018/m.23669 type:complete len:664 (+) Transcript_9018:1140-3131(+)
MLVHNAPASHRRHRYHARQPIRAGDDKHSLTVAHRQDGGVNSAERCGQLLASLKPGSDKSHNRAPRHRPRARYHRPRAGRRGELKHDPIGSEVHTILAHLDSNVASSMSGRFAHNRCGAHNKRPHHCISEAAHLARTAKVRSSHSHKRATLAQCARRRHRCHRRRLLKLKLGLPAAHHSVINTHNLNINRSRRHMRGRTARHRAERHPLRINLLHRCHLEATLEQRLLESRSKNRHTRPSTHRPRRRRNTNHSHRISVHKLSAAMKSNPPLPCAHTQRNLVRKVRRRHPARKPPLPSTHSRRVPKLPKVARQKISRQSPLNLHNNSRPATKRPRARAYTLDTTILNEPKAHPTLSVVHSIRAHFHSRVPAVPPRRNALNLRRSHKHPAHHRPKPKLARQRPRVAEVDPKHSHNAPASNARPRRPHAEHASRHLVVEVHPAPRKLVPSVRAHLNRHPTNLLAGRRNTHKRRRVPDPRSSYNNRPKPATAVICMDLLKTSTNNSHKSPTSQRPRTRRHILNPHTRHILEGHALSQRKPVINNRHVHLISLLRRGYPAPHTALTNNSKPRLDLPKHAVGRVRHKNVIISLNKHSRPSHNCPSRRHSTDHLQRLTCSKDHPVIRKLLPVVAHLHSQVASLLRRPNTHNLARRKPPPSDRIRVPKAAR